MKDLRFKIIADFVSGGFDRASVAINSLKTKFLSFFNGQKGGWGQMAGVIGIAVTAIKAAGDAMRESWIRDLDFMRDSTADFSQDTAKNLRRIKFISSDEEKAAVVEKLDNQIREIEKRRKKIADDKALESKLQQQLGGVQATIRGVTGGRFEESDDMQSRILGDQLKDLQNQRALALGRETKDAAKAAKAKVDATRSIEKEWMDEEASLRAKRFQEKKAMHEWEKAWAKEEADARQAAIDRIVSAETAAAEKRIKLRELVEGVNQTRRDIAYENATPEKRRAMDIARFREISKQVNAKNALGDFALDPEKRAELIKEGLRLQASLRGTMATQATRAAVQDATVDDGLTRRMSGRLSRGGARGGLRWRAGAMASEAAGTPTPPEDPQLRETKRTNSLLERIEKKTGAAP